MNFYTFKRDQAQFLLHFRDHDRAGGIEPLGGLAPLLRPQSVASTSMSRSWRCGKQGRQASARERMSWQILARSRVLQGPPLLPPVRDDLPRPIGASNLALVPPPLQQVLSGVPERRRTHDLGTGGQLVLTAPRDDDRPGRPLRSPPLEHGIRHEGHRSTHSPELRASGSASRTRIPEPLRTALRDADRQRLVDFVNTLELLDWNGKRALQLRCERGVLAGLHKRAICTSARSTSTNSPPPSASNWSRVYSSP